jgi:hypothetical protein
MITPSEITRGDDLAGSGSDNVHTSDHANGQSHLLESGMPSTSILHQSAMTFQGMAGSGADEWQYAQIQSEHLVSDANTLSRPSFVDAQPWSQDDVDRILFSLQENLPDVGRLFDGSIGMF